MLSYIENIQTILQAVKNTNPKTILDVGGGMGKYALLIREQELSDRASAGDLSPVSNLTIDCCEDTLFFTEQKSHQGLYDNHNHYSIFDIDFPKPYDLTLFIDTVEHWDKDKTKALLKKLGGLKLISTPKNTVMYTQHFYGDERHHCSQWTIEDFKDFEIVKDYSNTLSHILLIK